MRPMHLLALLSVLAASSAALAEPRVELRCDLSDAMADVPTLQEWFGGVPYYAELVGPYGQGSKKHFKILLYLSRNVPFMTDPDIVVRPYVMETVIVNSEEKWIYTADETGDTAFRLESSDGTMLNFIGSLSVEEDYGWTATCARTPAP
jgi:hypothetical protein